MSETLRLFGSELSPYSVKVRSYLRFKGIAHEWVVRSPANAEEFARYARLPLVPLVVTAEGEGIQDSTPILERFEAEHPEPSVLPEDRVARFVSALLEEYADEWGNKHMFHYRWWYEPDQISTARRIAASTLGEGAEPGELDAAAEAVRARMVTRKSFVGSSEVTRPCIERSFVDLLRDLDAHLATRPFVMGGRPGMADFGLWAQLYEAYTDPTAGTMIRETTTALEPWIERMLEPRVEGAFETWSSLAPSLEILLQHEVSARFLPWTLANAAALEAGEASFSIELAGQRFEQAPQKYHARSFAALRAKYDALEDTAELDEVLARVGCLAAFAA